MGESNERLIGPHEGRELHLMLDGSKPLSLFSMVEGEDSEHFDEAEFDSHVSAGRLIKRARTREQASPAGRIVEIRQIYYSLPQEEWRMSALQFVEDLYQSRGPGWRPDLERIIGGLLGYAAESVEYFIERLRRNGAHLIAPPIEDSPDTA